MKELFTDFQQGCEADFCQPLFDYISAKNGGRHIAPYIPTWDVMPLHKLCSLALLWHSAGFEIEAAELASWLVSYKKTPSLWCPESEFNEKEICRLFDLLSAIEPIAPENPPERLAELFHSDLMSAAFTLSGKGTSLGVIRLGDVEIRAFGPQRLPLSHAQSFGINDKGINGWTRVLADPECWLEMKHQFLDNECVLDIQFIGLKPEMPMAFVFYIKAKDCQIGNEIFQPKTLRHFNGQAHEVVFQNQCIIESKFPHKVQMIPLAGEGCFWNCEFLLSFEISPFEPQLNFLIKQR